MNINIIIFKILNSLFFKIYQTIVINFLIHALFYPGQFTNPSTLSFLIEIVNGMTIFETRRYSIY